MALSNATCPLRIKWVNRSEATQPRVILDYTIDSSYLTSTDTFQITLYDDDPARLRDLVWEPVELEVDGLPQLIGRVETVEQGRDGPAIAQIGGRDYLAELVEGNVDPTLKITKDMTIWAAIGLAVSPYGISGIVDDSQVTLRNVLTGYSVQTRQTPKDVKALKLQELTPQDGQGCYDFINKIAQQHGVTIQPSTTRTQLRVVEPIWDQEPAYTAWRGATSGGNIMSGWKAVNGGRTPTYALALGEQGQAGKAAKPLAIELSLLDIEAFRPLSEQFAVTTRRVPGKAGESEIPQAKLYRLLYLKDKNAQNKDQLERALARQLGNRVKDLLTYQCTMLGHSDSQTGAVYSVDTVIQVNDEWSDLSEPVWIARRVLRWRSGEHMTDLECWRLGALQL